MSAPTREELEALAEEASHGRGQVGSPAFDLDNALGDWAAEFMRLVWERWPCGDENCPARPEWDEVIDQVIYGQAVTKLERQLTRQIKRWFVARALEIAERFPEATRAKPEEPEPA